MASPIRGIQSVDQQMLEHLKYSGIAQENLVDLVGLFVSLKNKYGLIPFAMTAESNPIPNGVTAKYTVDSITLNKLTNILLDTPRLKQVTISPRGIPKSGQYEVAVTLGG
jgi:hypothetical protein